MRRSPTSPSAGPPAFWTATFERSVAFCRRPQSQTGEDRRRADGRPAYARPARPSATGVVVRTVTAAAAGRREPVNVTCSVPPRLPGRRAGPRGRAAYAIASAYDLLPPGRQRVRRGAARPAERGRIGVRDRRVRRAAVRQRELGREERVVRARRRRARSERRASSPSPRRARRGHRPSRNPRSCSGRPP